jgi:ATP-dependent helicase HrpA
MCLEAGRGRSGRIGCTQPRRIAAIAIARRIAEEMGETLGRAVGYKIRFDDATSRETRIKVLTDGMLLAETPSDPRLVEYDTLIIDEAHERSLNVDFLLGIAKTLLPVRPDLRLVITSATLDIEKFAVAFDRPPVIEVSGRLYPVGVEYRPSAAEKESGDGDYIQAAVEAVDYLRHEKASGDILIFMPTEQDILETCDILEGRRYAGVTILPLYARLPGPQQGRIYSVGGSKIVVATNVAETSLTIPGIRYVIDTGLARISQYLPGARINSLPIRRISQSSADQRKGRCGRVARGLCLRLYSEDDYDSRPRYTPPEILRSNLAEVILRMIDLGLGHPSRFPFVDRPQAKNIADGYETLLELGAIREKGAEYVLSGKGQVMARMPFDPRISRMLVEAQMESCLPEVAVIAAALSIRDPRERPPEKAAQADAVHAPFRHPDSDFLTLLNIWTSYHGDFERLGTQRQKRAFCHEHFLSFPRMREWTLIHGEIMEILKELRIAPGRSHKGEVSKELYARIHRSILSGYLSNIARHKEKNVYLAAKGREVMVFPGSTLFQKQSSWIVAAEMVKTSRLFARTAAKIDAGWLEALGGGLCRSTYENPRWDKKSGEVIADEHVSLFGLEIVSGRRARFGPIDPEASNRIFVRSALVAGDIKDPPEFLRDNLELRRRLRNIEEKLRRRDILAGEEAEIEFYSRRLAGVYDVRGLKARIGKRGGEGFLKMNEANLLKSFPDPGELSLFPDELVVNGRRFRASYKFSPGEPDDGVTLRIPLSELDRISPEPLEWGVPGLFREKIMALIRGLPKQHRKRLFPASEAADAIVTELKAAEESLFRALARFVKQRFGADISEREWARVELPPHLRVRLAVIEPSGKELMAGRDLAALQKVPKEAAPTAEQAPEVWAKARAAWERTGIVDWDLGELAESTCPADGIVAYPGLEPAERGANLRLFESGEKALESHRRGVQALFLLRFSKDLDFVRRYTVLPAEYQKIGLFFGGKEFLEKAMVERLKAEVFQKNVRSEREFKAMAEDAVRSLFEKSHALWEAVRPILDSYERAVSVLYALDKSSQGNKVLAELWSRLRTDLGLLVPKNFLEIYAFDRLHHLPRYVDGVRLRAERAKNDPEKDRRKATQVEAFAKTLERLKKVAARMPSPEASLALDEFRWMIEEFKVALFAPQLRTAFPVSPQRLLRKIKEIEEGILIKKSGGGDRAPRSSKRMGPSSR